MDNIDHLPSASVFLSPAVVHVRPFPWTPGGQGPQMKPAETWTLSKHCTPGWHGPWEHSDGPAGLDLRGTCGDLTAAVMSSLTEEEQKALKNIQRGKTCFHVRAQESQRNKIRCTLEYTLNSMKSSKEGELGSE